MADFDPKAFLNKYKDKEKEAEFDPKAFLSKHKQAEPTEESESFDSAAFLKKHKKEEPESAKTEESPKEETTAAQAATQGFLQELSFGWSDEAEAGLKAGKKWAQNLLAGKMEKSFGELYDADKKEIQDKLEQLQKEHGTAYGAGEAAGLVLPMLTGIGGVVKAGAKLAGKQLAKQVAKETAKDVGKATVGGAVEAAGKTEGDLKEAVLEGAETGAMFGAGGKLLGAGLGKVAKKLDPIQLKKMGATKNVFEKHTPEEIAELAKYARDNKILTSNVEKTLKNAEKLEQQATEQLVRVREIVGPEQMALTNRAELVDNLKALLPDYKGALRATPRRLINNAIRDVKYKGSDVEKFQQIISDIGIKTESADKRTAEAAKRLYAELSNALDKELVRIGEEITDEGLKKAYREANKEFSMTKKLANFARNNAAKVAGDPSLLNKMTNAAIVGGMGAEYLYPGGSGLGITATALGVKAGKAVGKKYAVPAATAAQRAAESNLGEVISRKAPAAIGRYTAGQAQEAKEEEKKKRKELIKSLQRPE